MIERRTEQTRSRTRARITSKADSTQKAWKEKLQQKWKIR